MDKLEKPMRSALKNYLMIMNIIIGIVILSIHFELLPKVIEAVKEISPDQAGVMKNRFFNATVGALIFIFLIDIYFWNLDNKLEKEKREARVFLKINPADSGRQEKLKNIERKRKLYISIIEPIFTIILGLIIGFLAHTILTPIYSLIIH